ncbi:ankyrin repeat domain-containing protein [Bradyrhizobium sp. AUGA SZCCT0177]|uniref:ankyrin repeat domain-containing protein n=1 Tax=Bradyrhizobium sp. AUGA SZCCT0177 TaxID=2807665 RepID=UPI001BACBFB3|nr:ankyrin repeat domain-containing protein [Bradyrhizobium sp. AUGA SZCCT0177]MBR1281318.1 ankyrin repeat domain-containing protein [Bradyrhizobium sp. AUGA SZCCT0177]
MRKITAMVRRAFATAILVVAISCPNGEVAAADKAVVSKERPRDEAQDRQSIELAKAIMSADPKFRDLIAGADPNAVIFINYQNEKYDLSLLTMATLLGDKEVITALIEAGARRGESCNIRHLVPVSLAFNTILPEFTNRRAALPRIMTGQAAMSCFLAEPYRKAVKRSDQALLDAVVGGSVEKVKRALSRGADRNAREQKLPGTVVWPGRTALMIALIERKPDIAELLIKAGADVNAKAAIASRWGGVDGIDALKIAINLKQGQIFKSLLQHGADATALDEGGNLAVHEAAARGDTPSLQALLANGAQLKAKDAIIARNKSGETPLVLAVRSHRPEAVAYLAGRGKELYGSDFLEYWGNGAIDEALTLRFVASDDASEKDRVTRKAGEILQILLKNGADSSFMGENGRTILMRAIETGFDLGVIQSVLDGKPQLNVLDRDGKDAYSFIQSRDDGKELKSLLDRARGSNR